MAVRWWVGIGAVTRAYIVGYLDIILAKKENLILDRASSTASGNDDGAVGGRRPGGPVVVRGVGSAAFLLK